MRHQHRTRAFDEQSVRRLGRSRDHLMKSTRNLSQEWIRQRSYVGQFRFRRVDIEVRQSTGGDHRGREKNVNGFDRRADLHALVIQTHRLNARHPRLNRHALESAAGHPADGRAAGESDIDTDTRANDGANAPGHQETMLDPHVRPIERSVKVAAPLIPLAVNQKRHASLGERASAISAQPQACVLRRPGAPYRWGARAPSACLWRRQAPKSHAS